MPLKRQTLDRRSLPQVSAAALRLWKLVREIQAERATERWEDDRHPGRRREYLDAEKALATACGLWWGDSCGPHDVKSPKVPSRLLHRPIAAAAYRAAWSARLALEQAEREAEDAAADGE